MLDKNLNQEKKFKLYEKIKLCVRKKNEFKVSQKIKIHDVPRVGIEPMVFSS